MSQNTEIRFIRIFLALISAIAIVSALSLVLLFVFMPQEKEQNQTDVSRNVNVDVQESIAEPSPSEPLFGVYTLSGVLLEKKVRSLIIQSDQLQKNVEIIVEDAQYIQSLPVPNAVQTISLDEIRVGEYVSIDLTDDAREVIIPRASKVKRLLQ